MLALRPSTIHRAGKKVERRQQNGGPRTWASAVNQFWVLHGTWTGVSGEKGIDVVQADKPHEIPRLFGSVS